MMNFVSLLVLFHSLLGLVAHTSGAPFNPTTSSNGISHKAWDMLLKKYVDHEGFVDYKGFRKDMAPLNSYLNYLGTHVPGETAAKEEKLAFYINLYNAATVKLILDNYPLASIRDIEDPWGINWIPLGTDLVSLGDIEHKILRKMDEPRIHFAINCASYSCPKLSDAAFTGPEVEHQLEEATLAFIQDPDRNLIRPDMPELSRIFSWYKEDFTRRGTLIEFINPYAETKIMPEAKIRYKKYDWSLNEAQ